MNYLPNGIIGILIVAILSAAMSTLSSTVNSLSAVSMEDFVNDLILKFLIEAMLLHLDIFLYSGD